MTAEQPRFRLGVLGIVVVSLFAALFARLWYLQVMTAPAGAAQAYGNRVRLVYEEAPRGRILDRQGRVLVDNRISNAVVVDRTKLTDRNRVVGRLATLLGVSDADLQSSSSGDALRRAYRLVVFPGHHEYVTAHEYDVVQRYRDVGGHLMALAGGLLPALLPI